MSWQIDLLDAFALLEEYKIIVARTGYVDSAENALVFANTRPIVLYPLQADGHWYDRARGEPASNDKTVHDVYRRLSEKFGARLLAQVDVESGTDVIVSGEERKGEKIVRFVSGTHDVERVCPLSEDAAESMLAEFHASKGLGSGEKLMRTLAHMLVKVAAMYVESEIDDFVLHVRVHDNGYKVLDAKMMTERMPKITKRLGRHAHDRKSYDYHPAGRQ